jgi:multiple sugar transport system substrate-binding protein
MAFMLEADNFNPWIESAQGYLTQCLTAYDKNPIWTADPKNKVFAKRRSARDRRRARLGRRESATAIADFVVLDMFANYCTGREDVKGSIAIAERQLKRIYR